MADASARYTVQKPLARMILLMLENDLPGRIEAWKRSLENANGDHTVEPPTIDDEERQVFAALGYLTGLRDTRVVKVPRPAAGSPTRRRNGEDGRS